ncbi:MAG TPA: hypothetical protein VF109_07795 [Mycobacteriales bacterium]
MTGPSAVSPADRITFTNRTTAGTAAGRGRLVTRLVNLIVAAPDGKVTG